MHYINFNGSIIPAATAPPPVEGSVFRFSGGLFESILVIDGRVQLTAYHFDRLIKGAVSFGYELPVFFTFNFFEEELLKTIAANTYEQDQRIRFQLHGENGKLQYLAEVSSITPDVYAFNDTGWKLGLTAGRLKTFDETGNLKTINIALYTNSTAIAAAHGWNDILLVKDRKIVESGTANIFWIKDGNIFTPPLKEGCIEGTMRRHLLKELQERCPVHEKELYVTGLMQADEVFLSNAVRRIKWVQQIADATYSNKLVSELHSWLFG